MNRQAPLKEKPEIRERFEVTNAESLDCLVQRAQHGDASACEQLLERFHPLMRSRMHRLWSALCNDLSRVEWDDVEAHVHLAYQVGDAGERIPAADRDYAFAMDSGVDQSREPQEAGEVRLFLRHPADRLVWDERDGDAGEGADMMVQPLEKEAVEVDEVSGDVQLHDLALALRQVDIAGDDAVDQQRGVGERASAASYGPASGKNLHVSDGAAKHGFLVPVDDVA